MGNQITIIREEVVDMVEELMLMGFDKRYQIWQAIKSKGYGTDYKTIGKYMDVVRRRSRKRFREVDIKNVLKKELGKLSLMERQAWKNFMASEPGNEKSGALITISKIMERRAKLLGLDTEERPAERTLEDLIKDDDEENEQTINRGAVLDNKQGRPAGEVSAESSAEISERSSGEQKPDIETEAKGS